MGDGQPIETCPTCDTHALGSAYVVMLTTRGGHEVEANLCGACGTVYCPTAADQLLGYVDGGAADD